MHPHEQQGTVIIFSLFIVSIVTVISVALMDSLSRNIRHTALLQNYLQAELYAQGSLATTMARLTNTSIEAIPLSLPLQFIQQNGITSTIDNAQNYLSLHDPDNLAWLSFFKINSASEFFIIKTTVKTKDQQLKLYSLVQRKIKNSRPIVEIIWQTSGDS